MSNGRLAVHLIWAGVVLAVSAQVAWVTVAIHAQKEQPAAITVFLAVAGPALAGLGVLYARLGTRRDGPQDPPEPPST